MSELAPGRYCLAVCYCRQCDHYVPIRRDRPTLSVVKDNSHHAKSWADREEPTWLDRD